MTVVRYVLVKVRPGVSLDEFEKFLFASRDHAHGWVGFYWGKTPAELRQELTRRRSKCALREISCYDVETFFQTPPSSFQL